MEKKQDCLVFLTNKVGPEDPYYRVWMKATQCGDTIRIKEYVKPYPVCRWLDPEWFQNRPNPKGGK